MSMRTPMLLLHGLASTHETTWSIHGWDDLLAGLGYQVIPFALPGHGGDPGLSPVDAQAAVRDAAEAAGACTAMGFSAGATLMMQVSVAFPELFTTRVHLGVGDRAFGVDRSRLQARAQELKTAVGAGDPWIRTIVRSLERSGLDRHRVADYLAAAPPAPSLEALAGLPGRCLFIVGADDPSGPLHVVEQELPESDTVVIPGCDHFRLTAHPQAMRVVETFLS